MMWRRTHLRRLFALVGYMVSLPLFAIDGNKPDLNRPLVTEPVGMLDYMQMFLGLALVLVLIFGMAWLVRRMGSFQQLGQGALRVIGGLSVGQRERIVLVQVGETQLLIGLAQGQIRTLHVLDKPVAANMAQTAHGTSFAERLQSVMKGNPAK